MQTDESVRSGLRGVQVARHVLSVDQFQLRLLGVAAEWKARFQALKASDALREVARSQAGLGEPIERLLVGLDVQILLVVIAEERHPRTASAGDDERNDERAKPI